MGEENSSPQALSNNKLKFLQLADHISRQIDRGELKVGDRIPSLNQLKQFLLLSKETVFKEVSELIGKGIIESVYRKGYYVKTNATQHQYRLQQNW